MTNINYCYIVEQYYQDHPNLVKILDLGNLEKHNIRTHLCLNIKYKNNNILIPLRKNLGNEIRPFGRIGHAVPSASKPNAGLDYRYMMIINESKYLRYDSPRISNRQVKLIQNDYMLIEHEAIEYINSYIKKANKGRIEATARFRESSLINFHKKLGIFYIQE